MNSERKMKVPANLKFLNNVYLYISNYKMMESSQKPQILKLEITAKRSTTDDRISQEIIEKCIRIAMDALEGKRDRDGNALILHSLIVGSMGQTDAEKCVGFLHDVVEDSDWTFEDLVKAGIPNEIVQTVRLCTREDGMEYYDYVQRIIDSDNMTAIHVKLNDLHHNLARGKAFNYTRLIEKHRKALKMIEDAMQKE